MKQLRQTATVNAQVLDALRTAVITGELSPGTLHSVATLAGQLGVSRTPVREALIKLAQQGMVRFERNRGVRILQTSLHDLEEVFALRLLLEVPATRRAVQLLTPATQRALRTVFGAMEKAAAADDEFRMWEHDRRFHRVLLEASGNGRLAEYVDSLRDMVLRRGVSTAHQSRTLEGIVAEHRAVLERVEEGDADGAADAMHAHILHTAQLLLAQEAGVPVGTVDVDLGWTARTLLADGSAQVADGAAQVADGAAQVADAVVASSLASSANPARDGGDSATDSAEPGDVAAPTLGGTNARDSVRSTLRGAGR